MDQGGAEYRRKMLMVAKWRHAVELAAQQRESVISPKAQKSKSIINRWLNVVEQAREAAAAAHAGVHDDPDVPEEEDREAFLEEVAQDMLKNVEVKDRNASLRTHRKCFVGKEAVKFLQWSGRAANIAQAVVLGNELMQQGLFYHVTNDHAFKNENLFYRFKVHDKDYQAAPGQALLRNSLRKDSTSTQESWRSLQPIDEGTELEAKLDEIYAVLLDNVEIKDRTFRLKTYKSCFVGRDAVKFLVEYGHAANHDEAVAIGQALLRRGTLQHVCQDQDFQDDYFFYRFKIHEPLYIKGMQWLQTSGLDDRLKVIARDMLWALEVKDRSWRFVNYKRVFVGTEAVKLLRAKGHAADDDEAVQLGEALLQQGAFAHVTKQQPFKNEYFFYRFTAHEDDYLLASVALPVGSATSGHQAASSQGSYIGGLRRAGWQPAVESCSEDELTEKLEVVAKDMMDNLDIKDRQHHLKWYYNCFTGREAMQFLLDQSHVTSKETGIALGNALIARGTFSNISGGENTFKDSDMLYRFKAHDEDIRKGLHWLRRSRLESKQEEVTKAMIERLEIRDRKHFMTTYKKCFVGKDAVKFMMENGFANTLDEAILLGNQLMERDVFQHVTNEHAFKNEELFYRFKAHEEDSIMKKKGQTHRHAHRLRQRKSSRQSIVISEEWDEETAGSFEPLMLPGLVQRGWRMVMDNIGDPPATEGPQGREWAFSALYAIDIMGQDTISAGLLHWGLSYVTLALSFIEKAALLTGTGPVQPGMVDMADALLGKAGQRYNEALQYKPSMYAAAMMMGVLHHIRAVMHSGLCRVKETMAYFNICLASGGVLTLEAKDDDLRAPSMLSSGLADVNRAEREPLENGEDPVAAFISAEGDYITTSKSTLQVDKVMAADVHFNAAYEIFEATLKMLPPEHRPEHLRGNGKMNGVSNVMAVGSSSHYSSEDPDKEDGNGRTLYEDVLDMWGMAMFEQSQIWAAVGRNWRDLLDLALDKLKQAGVDEQDIDIVVSAHIKSR